MRVVFPPGARVRHLDPNEVRRFQTGPCWVWSDERGLTLFGLRLKLSRGWFTVAAWPEIGSFVEAGRIVQQADLSAVLEGSGPQVPY